MNNYQIIFVDIDDTLNVRNQPITDKTKEVMKRIKEKNIPVVINTGRSMKYAIDRSITGNLGHYVISSNGSEVYDYKNNKLIFSSIIPKDIVKKIYEYCENVQLTMTLNSYENKFSNNKENINEGDFTTYFDNIDEVLENNDITQIVLVSDNFDRMIVLPKLFQDKFPDIKFTYSSHELLENKRVKGHSYTHNITMNHVSKGTGIVELLDYLKIPNDKAIALGDDIVDLAMFDVVKTGIAVADGVDVLKSRASYICPSAKENGVATILEKMILKEE